ncbi:MAG: hypothetical protein IJG65_10350, partial [Synergistaceae bacterium]|nr:hypothetical protein [Synergistaceae bacterium]
IGYRVSYCLENSHHNNSQVTNSGNNCPAVSKFMAGRFSCTKFFRGGTLFADFPAVKAKI